MQPNQMEKGQVVNYVVYNPGFHLSGPLSLPLLSRGYPALLINLALTGLMLSVFRCGDIVKDGFIPSSSPADRFVTWDGRRLTIDFGKKSRRQN